MIKIYKGFDVLDVTEGIIVHSCNNKGVMGSGIALEIKQRFPEAYDIYKEAERKYGLTLGSVSKYYVSPDKIIVNGIGQDGYGTSGRRYTDYEAIAGIFESVNLLATEIYEDRGILLPICFPLIGCHRGGGKWSIVSAIIDNTVDDKFEKRLYVLQNL